MCLTREQWIGKNKERCYVRSEAKTSHLKMSEQDIKKRKSKKGRVRANKGRVSRLAGARKHGLFQRGARLRLRKKSKIKNFQVWFVLYIHST
jgi:hypothetical protein